MHDITRMPAEIGSHRARDGENRAIQFSLILATIGRNDEPRRFLKHLNAQTYRNFELVVVDQHSDDTVARMLTPYQDSYLERR